MAEECDVLVKKLVIGIRDFTNLERMMAMMEQIRPYAAEPSEAYDAWRTLDTTIARKHSESWGEIEELLKKLPKICK